MTRNDAIARIRARVGPAGCVDGADAEPYLVETRGLYHGAAALVVRPASTEEVSDIVGICRDADLKIVPQGGNTGLCGGAVPDAAGSAILLSLTRMNRVRAVDAANFTLVAEAGCVLADIQREAATRDLLFPVSLGAEGSCQIGGNIATNAGGLQVLRYGTMRDQVLGLEVVLPDGRVWNGLKALRKDNTGYDLKQLFIGSEGTLGIVTAAALRLYPALKTRGTALVGVTGPEQALALLALAREQTGDLLTAFELMPRIGLEFARRHVSGVADPLGQPYPWYVLIEIGSSAAGAPMAEDLSALLGHALDRKLALDATVAASLAQAEALWRIREGLVEAQRFEGGSIKHDVSVPVSAVPEFIRVATAAVIDRLPTIRPVPFGHMGDGNIHFNLSQPEGADRATYLERWAEFNRIVHDIVAGFGGSMSAEHGIGILKREEMRRYKSDVELELMTRIKAAIDPENRMNPGKLLP